MTARDELPTLRFASASEWERWLERWHERSPGLWLQMAKKGTGVASCARRWPSIQPKQSASSTASA